MSDVSRNIYLLLEKEVQRKIAMKKGYRKKIKVLLEKEIRGLLRKIFSSNKVKVKEYDGGSDFGCDSLGRDIYAGLNQYINILKSRRIHVHTLIVLGSRAKGNWRPESDVDVTIIASNLPKGKKNFFIVGKLFELRRSLILSDRPLYLGIEPSNCSCKEEFLKQLERLDINALDAVLYGKVICDDGFWLKVKGKYEEIKKKYKLNDDVLREKLKAI
ncbi:MAG: nucleotidyltransferase domain-containing protein [Candidatus Bathyarchaeia archaeon]